MIGPAIPIDMVGERERGWVGGRESRRERGEDGIEGRMGERGGQERGERRREGGGGEGEREREYKQKCFQKNITTTALC